jgi:hypothetical protein
MNMENQLITGYDAKGFDTARPWECNTDFPPARLTFGSWRELGDPFHVSFFTLTQAPPADRLTTILASLDYAVDLYANPARHSRPGYGIGPDAYATWIAAVPEHGASHGNWWNATVWSECRKMASGYFGEIAAEFPHVAPRALDLGRTFAAIGELLGRASDKAMPAAEKTGVLTEAQRQESEAIPQVVALAEALRVA